jgi:hypothetical protein
LYTSKLNQNILSKDEEAMALKEGKAKAASSQVN